MNEINFYLQSYRFLNNGSVSSQIYKIFYNYLKNIFLIFRYKSFDLHKQQSALTTGKNKSDTEPQTDSVSLLFSIEIWNFCLIEIYF